MICPFITRREGGTNCDQGNCAWWCDGEGECCMKVIAMEMIRANESN